MFSFTGANGARGGWFRPLQIDPGWNIKRTDESIFRHANLPIFRARVRTGACLFALAAVAAGFGAGSSQRSVRSRRRSERRRRGAGLCCRRLAPSRSQLRRSPRDPVGAGPRRAQAGRAALPSRTAARLPAPADPRDMRKARRRAVRARGKSTLPRSGCSDWRGRRQSQGVRFHRLAPPDADRRAARRAAVAGAARCGS